MNTSTYSHCSALESLAQRICDRSVDAHTLGDLGEQYATAWLLEQQWILLDANWHSRYGEIDMVMLDPSRTLVFVEVKTRRSTQYGSPQEAVTPHKQKAVRTAGAQWLLCTEHRALHYHNARFDVITVLVERKTPPTIRHIQGAF